MSTPRADYAQKHEVIVLLRDMTEALLRAHPEDPIPFLIQHLQQPRSVVATANAIPSDADEL